MSETEPMTRREVEALKETGGRLHPCWWKPATMRKLEARGLGRAEVEA